MKKIILSFIIGFTLGGGLAYAAGSFRWVNDSGATYGTVSNPVYITTQ